MAEKETTVQYFIPAQALEVDTQPGDTFGQKLRNSIRRKALENMAERDHILEEGYPHIFVQEAVLDKENLGYNVEARLTWN